MVAKKVECTKFSIVVPVYNVQEYIHHCLESLVNQNYSNFEIILVDDGSKDDSAKICDNYALRYENVSVYHKENGGLSDARNFGLLKSKGDFILFVDSDDVIEEETCLQFNNIIQSKKQIDLIAGNAVQVFGEKIIGYQRNLHSNVCIDGINFLKNELKAKSYTPAACFYCYNRDFLLKNQLFFSKGLLHEDEEFMPRVLLEASRVTVLNYTFYRYLIRENSITQSKVKTRNAQCIFQISRELSEKFDSVSDNKLKVLFKDRLDSICFKAIKEAKLLEDDSENIIDYHLLKSNAFSLKNKFRYFLMKYNKRLLNKIMKARG